MMMMQAGCQLDAELIPLLVQHLTSQQRDTRSAAAAALADAVAQHPDTTSSSLAAVVGLYGEDPEEDMDEVRAAVLLDDAERAARQAAQQQLEATRSGVATALEALSGVLSGADVHTALDFLVNRGLAERVDAIREAMVGAGEQHMMWAFLGGVVVVTEGAACMLVHEVMHVLNTCWVFYLLRGSSAQHCIKCASFKKTFPLCRDCTVHITYQMMATFERGMRALYLQVNFNAMHFCFCCYCCCADQVLRWLSLTARVWPSSCCLSWSRTSIPRPPSVWGCRRTAMTWSGRAWWCCWA